MKLLAVDTATQTCSVAIAEDDRIRIEVTSDHARTHARHLLTMIDDVLQQSDMDIGELDGFAVTVGPGSFTGLRIGISTVKGLAHAVTKPVAAISTLEALAYSVAGFPGLVYAWIDARKKEVYTALYRWEGDRFGIVTPPQVVSPDEALRQIDGPCIFLGNGADAYRRLIESMRGETSMVAPPSMNVIRASIVARLGLIRFLEHAQISARELHPLYIRRSDAELYAKTTQMRVSI